MIHGCKVLVVDDDPTWVELMAEILEDEGYVVSTADNGASALLEIQRFEPFVVVTDWKMPTMDGEQFLARVHDRDQRLPIIILSGEVPKSSGLRNAFRVIEKSMPLDAILSVIAEAAAHRVSRLPLEKLWRTATVRASPRRRVHTSTARRSNWNGMLRARLGDVGRFLSSSWSWVVAAKPRRILMIGILVASSAALIHHVSGE
jgi:CheY-like chemotaxis protein